MALPKTTRVRTLDDASVGSSGGDFFSPTKEKRRISILPCIVNDKELLISEALREKAASGDEVSVQTIDDLMGLKENLESGVKKEPPSAQRIESEKMKGFLFSRVDTCLTQYRQGVGYYICKEAEYKAMGRDCPCKSDSNCRDCFDQHGLVIIAYHCDSTGKVIPLPEDRQRPLDAENKLDFKFDIQFWTLSDGKMRVLREHFDNFPPLLSDYVVWTEKQGTGDRLKASPLPGTALWQSRGPVLKEKIIKTAEEKWEKVSDKIARNMEVKDIDTMYGITTAPESQNESSYKNLLG